MCKPQNTVFSEVQIRRLLNPQGSVELVSGQLKLLLRESVLLHGKWIEDVSDIEPGGNMPLHLNSYHPIPFLVTHSVFTVGVSERSLCVCVSNVHSYDPLSQL